MFHQNYEHETEEILNNSWVNRSFKHLMTSKRVFYSCRIAWFNITDVYLRWEFVSRLNREASHLDVPTTRLMIDIIHRAHLGLSFILKVHLMTLDLDFPSTYRQSSNTQTDWEGTENLKPSSDERFLDAHIIPGLCLMLLLDPHLDVTLLKSTFLLRIWTWEQIQSSDTTNESCSNQKNKTNQVTCSAWKWSWTPGDEENETPTSETTSKKWDFRESNAADLSSTRWAWEKITNKRQEPKPLLSPWFGLFRKMQLSTNGFGKRIWQRSSRSISSSYLFTSEESVSLLGLRASCGTMDRMMVFVCLFEQRLHRMQ